MFQIHSVDKYDFKHPKKIKNGIFFKINLINPNEFSKMTGMDQSLANSPNKSIVIAFIFNKIRKFNNT